MNVDIISEELRELGLFVMAEKLGIASEKSLLKNYTNLEFLHSLLESEIEAKKERSYKMRLKLSSLPYLKTLAEFDFVFGKGVDKELIDELSGLAFVMNGSNICFLAPLEWGKPI